MRNTSGSYVLILKGLTSCWVSKVGTQNSLALSACGTYFQKQTKNFEMSVTSQANAFTRTFKLWKTGNKVGGRSI